MGINETEAIRGYSMTTRESIRITDNVARLDDAVLQFGQEPMRETLNQYVDFVDAQESMDAVAAGTRAFAFDRKPMADALTTTFFWGFLWGYHDTFADRRAPTDLTRKQSTLFGLRQVETRIPVQLADAQYKPLPPLDAIEIFRRREIMTREQFEMILDQYARREAFFATGITLDNIEKHLYPAVMDALVEGTTLAEFRASVEELLLSRARTETIFRTNLMTAYNSGHMDAMYDPLIADLIPALQFLAIIDGRTTEICRRLNNQIIMKDQAGAADLIPPLHYSCRSTVIPVWIDEFRQLEPGQVFDPASIYTVPDAPRPQEGFGSWQPILNAVR